MNRNDALKAMIDGKKITMNSWNYVYVYFNGSQFLVVEDDQEEDELTIWMREEDGYEILKEEKKFEFWVNVYDNDLCDIYYSEKEADYALNYPKLVGSKVIRLGKAEKVVMKRKV